MLSRSRLLFLVASLALLVPLVGTALAGAQGRGQEDDDGDSLFKYLSIFTEVLGLARTAYVEPVDVERLLADALAGTVDALDPFAVYVPRSAAAAFASAQQVGWTRSGLLLGHERGVIFAVVAVPGSPAAAAGVSTGDILAKVDGRETRQMGLWEIESRLAAPAGTEVEIEWIRRGEPRRHRLVLADFALPTAQREEVSGVALVRLPVLTAASAGEVRRLLGELAAAGASRLVLDLAGSVARDAADAYSVAGLFVDGPLGALASRGNRLTEFQDREPDAWRGDLAVVIDSGTAGGAELLATILKQRLGARLVGERSFGFAGRSEVIGLASGGQLRLATAFYSGPDGDPLRQGLKPDVEVDEGTRAFGDKEVPIAELRRRKAAELLLAAAPASEKKAA